MGRPKQPWRASPDPEIFEDADAEWEVDRIVSEEIDLFGRRWLEIKWGQWERADGTNTTFQEDLENQHVVRDWEKRRRDARNELAAESLAIDIQGPEVPDHFYRTFEVANAMEEKLRLSQASVGSRYSSWETLRHLGSSTWRSETSSLRSSSRSKDSVPRSQSSVSKRPLVPSSSASTDERPSKIPKTTPVSARKALLNRWLHECRQAGAPGIRLRNDVDNEEIPPINPRFIYLENSYDFGNVRLTGSDEEWLAGCTCEGPCSGNDCDCLTMISDEDEPSPAYRRGLFTLNRNVVVECNKFCSCQKAQCGNRIAQWGRDIEIEIFKTSDGRGWGACALQDLPAGKFLGLYTGRLILREHAAKLSDDHRSYTFDLDSLDNGTNVPADQRYSVDAASHGNWTRFVNHSCRPNVQVYSVMWDTTPQMNRPYLAFVTNKPIAARTEFTIDYDPKAALDSKGKKKRPPGSRECRCGADICRGWVAV